MDFSPTLIQDEFILNCTLCQAKSHSHVLGGHNFFFWGGGIIQLSTPYVLYNSVYLERMNPFLGHPDDFEGDCCNKAYAFLQIRGYLDCEINGMEMFN